MQKGQMITARRGSLAHNLYGQAEEFLDAAQIVYDAPDQPNGAIGLGAISLRREVKPARGLRAPLALNFCLLHAAELFLKSYLSDKGVEAATPRSRFRHDVGKLIDAAREEDLQISPELEEMLRGLVEANEQHALRYQENSKPISLPPAGLFIQHIEALGKSILMARSSRSPNQE